MINVLELLLVKKVVKQFTNRLSLTILRLSSPSSLRKRTTT